MTSTRTTVRARAFSARRCAAVAPTFPAPTTVILLTMGVRSPSACVHFSVGIRAERVDAIERASLCYAQPLLRATVSPSPPPVPDDRRQLLVRRAAAQWLPQIHAALRVEAQQPRAVRRDAASVAGAAEWGGRRRDDPERGPVGQPEPLRGCAARLDERLARSIAPATDLEDRPLRHDLLHRPARGPPHVHVFGDPYLGLVRAGEIDQVDQLVVVDPPEHSRIELGLVEPG